MPLSKKKLILNLKSLLPRRLFYRALLIVATPIILLQITVSVVFFDAFIKIRKLFKRLNYILPIFVVLPRQSLLTRVQ